MHESELRRETEMPRFAPRSGIYIFIKSQLYHGSRCAIVYVYIRVHVEQVLRPTEKLNATLSAFSAIMPRDFSNEITRDSQILPVFEKKR